MSYFNHSCLLLLFLLFLPAGFSVGAETDHADRVSIDPAVASQAGITIAAVDRGRIERHINVYGRLVAPPDHMARVHARFPGVIHEVTATVGDWVSRGQVLARVESNESLQPYPVRAPITGVVQQRRANAGEMTDAQPLFQIVNDDHLWAELKIFPSQRMAVKAGMSVHVFQNHSTFEGRIASVIADTQGQPYVVARVVLDNSDGRAAPGDLVRAQIDAEVVDVALAVDVRGLQEIDGEQVVFVREGNQYTARPVKLGRKAGQLAEVLSGLNAGERYVVENSYLIKADLEKAGAEHSH